MIAAGLVLSNLTHDLQRFVDYVSVTRDRAVDGAEGAVLFGILSAAERLLVAARVAEPDGLPVVLRQLYQSEAQDVRPDLFEPIDPRRADSLNVGAAAAQADRRAGAVEARTLLGQIRQFDDEWGIGDAEDQQGRSVYLRSAEALRAAIDSATSAGQEHAAGFCLALARVLVRADGGHSEDDAVRDTVLAGAFGPLDASLTPVAPTPDRPPLHIVEGDRRWSVAREALVGVDDELIRLDQAITQSPASAAEHWAVGFKRLTCFAGISLSALTDAVETDDSLEVHLARMPARLTPEARERRDLGNLVQPRRPALPREVMTAAVARCCSASADPVRAGALMRRELMRAIDKAAGDAEGDSIDLRAQAVVLQTAFTAAACDAPAGVDADAFLLGFSASVADALYTPACGLSLIDPIEGDPVASLELAGLCAREIRPFEIVERDGVPIVYSADRAALRTGLGAHAVASTRTLLDIAEAADGRERGELIRRASAIARAGEKLLDASRGFSEAAEDSLITDVLERDDWLFGRRDEAGRVVPVKQLAEQVS